MAAFENALEHCGRLGAGIGSAGLGVGGEHLLGCVPGGALNNCRVLATIDFPLVWNVAQVVNIVEHPIHMGLVPGLAGNFAPCLGDPRLGRVARIVKFPGQLRCGTQRQISLENPAHEPCLGFVDDQFLGLAIDIVPQRRHAPEIHAPPFHGGDLVADAFSGDFPFELRETEKQV